MVPIQLSHNKPQTLLPVSSLCFVITVVTSIITIIITFMINHDCYGSSLLVILLLPPIVIVLGSSYCSSS